MTSFHVWYVMWIMNAPQKIEMSQMKNEDVLGLLALPVIQQKKTIAAWFFLIMFSGWWGCLCVKQNCRYPSCFLWHPQRVLLASVWTDHALFCQVISKFVFPHLSPVFFISCHAVTILYTISVHIIPDGQDLISYAAATWRSLKFSSTFMAEL